MWRRATSVLFGAVVTAALPLWSQPVSAEAERTPAVPKAVAPVTPGDPQRTVPERVEKDAPPPTAPAAKPPTAPAAKETLTDRFDRTDGVLKPPAGIAPPMNVPAPAPHIDREMVVPVPAPAPVPPPPVEPSAPQSPPR